jgi:predicted O-methyltransferase YrrM
VRGRPTISTDEPGASRLFVDAYRPEDDLLDLARQRGEEIGVASVSPATGATLHWLAQLIGARAVAEIGTGAGVSGLWLLRGMASDGVLTTVDDEAENTRAARQTFTEAGVPTQRVRLITGRPLDVLSRLADAAYDLVFFDANPQESTRYLDEALRLLRPGGLAVFDDALLGDRVADPAQRDPETIAVRTLVNETREDERIRPLLLPVGDGLLVAQKLEA